jgi:hypothetical protein
VAHEWIADNTFRTPKTRGCGVGLPARGVCGIHVAKSKMGYKSLGASSEKATKAQHCPAEVHLFDIGWVPVDPADVRKVVLEEPPGNLHDVALPGSSSAPLGFFMYLQAEITEGRLDCLDPDGFKYELHSARSRPRVADGKF